MAKQEYRINADFEAVAKAAGSAGLDSGTTSNAENGSDFASGDFRCAVRIFERYSAFSGSRVSLNVTVAGRDGDVFVSAITSGGSRAMVFKIDTVGEESFLEAFHQAFMKNDWEEIK